MKKTGLYTAIILGVFLVCGVLYARKPDLIPREILFENPERIEPCLSPDGTMIAYLAPYKGVQNIWIRTIGKSDDRVITEDKGQGIKHYIWCFDGRHILYAQDRESKGHWHIYSIDISKKRGDPVDLTPFAGVTAKVLKVSPERPSKVLIMMNRDDPSLHDVYLLDISSGNLEPVQKNPGNVLQWVANDYLEILGALASLPNGGGALMYRESPDAIWQNILTWNPGDDVMSAGFSADGRYWYLEHNINSDLIRLVKRNLKTGREETIFSPTEGDLGKVFICRKTGKPLAVSEYYERMKWHVLDKAVEDDFKYLESQLKRGEFYIYTRDVKDEKWLIAYSMPDRPIYYYIYHKKGQKLNFLFSHRPKLEKMRLPSRKPVIIPTRDGLKMVCYLTLPLHEKAKNLPLVLYPHEFLWSRHEWSFTTIPPWLASRGYAVLQVNYRGSWGFGKKFLNAGNREWGGKIIDDLEDAANWAVKKGIADRKKVGIFGFAFGGYLATESTAVKPDLFNCSVSYAAPISLLTYMESLPAYYKPFLNMLKIRVGDFEQNPKFIKSISPYYNAYRIKTPTLIARGDKDIFTKDKEYIEYSKFLKKRRIPVAYLELPEEGQGIPVRPENLLTFINFSEKFFARYLGGEYERASRSEKYRIKKVIKVIYMR